jgi:hypothetical protein
LSLFNYCQRPNWWHSTFDNHSMSQCTLDIWQSIEESMYIGLNCLFLLVCRQNNKYH